MVTAGSASALAVVALAVVGAVDPPGRVPLQFALLAFLAVCVHWLAAIFGWRFSTHSLAAYTASWLTQPEQRSVLASWPKAAIDANLTTKGARQTVAVPLPDFAYRQPRGVTLGFITPAASSLDSALHNATPALSAYYGRPVDTTHREGLTAVTIVHRDPLATPRRAQHDDGF
jgi:hypothetical protein